MLSLWGAEAVQSQLDGVVRNRTIYERLSKEMCDLGYERTLQQCRTKVKNMVARYRRAKDVNRCSGRGRESCPFYDQLDAILGTRAASEPAVLLESGAGAGEEPVRVSDPDADALLEQVETDVREDAEPDANGKNFPFTISV